MEKIYDVIGVHVFLTSFMRFLPKKVNFMAIILTAWNLSKGDGWPPSPPYPYLSPSLVLQQTEKSEASVGYMK